MKPTTKTVSTMDPLSNMKENTVYSYQEYIAICKDFLQNNQLGDSSINRIEEEQSNIDKALNMWRNTDSFENLKEKMIKYINGEVCCSYNHYGKLCEETEPLIPDLLLLNQAGFISLNGQPGMIEIDEEQYGERLCFLQKPYIEGILKKDLCDAVTNKLFKKGYIVRISTKDSVRLMGCPDSSSESPYWVTQTYVLKDGEKVSDLLNDDDEDDGLGDTKFPKDSMWKFDIETLKEYCTNEFYQTLCDDYVHLGICSQLYGPGRLEKDLLEAMK